MDSSASHHSGVDFLLLRLSEWLETWVQEENKTYLSGSSKTASSKWNKISGVDRKQISKIITAYWIYSVFNYWRW